MTPPIVIKILPIIMQLRRPSGMPIIMTRHDTNAAANVLDDAINGMVSVPLGCYKPLVFHPHLQGIIDIY